jgi:hypothetical protein
MEETGLNTIHMFDRYDSVVHLVTAAEGAEKFYDLKNAARTETPEQARQVDRSLIKAWEGHQQHFIIDNMHEGGFDAKMKSSANAILKTIGLPTSQNFYKQFLLKKNAKGEFVFDSKVTYQ